MSIYGPLIAAWGLGNYTNDELAACLANVERNLAVALGSDLDRLAMRREMLLEEQDGRALDETLAAVAKAMGRLPEDHPARPAIEKRLQTLLGRQDAATRQ